MIPEKKKNIRKARCGECRFFDNDLGPGMLEQSFSGLTVLGSDYGPSCGDAGLCSRHDLFLLPRHQCPDYRPKKNLPLCS